MIDLLSKLSSTSQNKPIEPREIFMSLPTKDKLYEYPRDVQSEVWKNGLKNVIKRMPSWKAFNYMLKVYPLARPQIYVSIYET